MKENRYFVLILAGLLVAAFAVGITSTAAQAVTKITFWHAMSAKRMPAVNRIVEGFNATHPDIKVEPQFSGKYKEVLAKAIAAARGGSPPHIVQVYEVGTQTMLDSGAIVPIFKIAKPGEIDWGDIIVPIKDYYAVDGKLYSMPFNSSTSILYYNKDLFRKAGLDPTKPPTTFAEMEKIGEKIVKSGVAPNAVSFGWPDWQFEQMHTLHQQFYADHQNGRAGRATKVFGNREFGVRVVSEWTKWAKKGIFLYGGPEYSANKAFLAQKIAMLYQSTSSVGSITKAAKFEVGTSFLPRLQGYPRGNTVIGGATLWTMKGHSQKEYDAVWEFYKYLVRPEVSAQWHKDTGYFPSTNSAVKLLMDQGWFSEHPNHLTAFLEILTGVKVPASQGVRLGPFVAIRQAFRTA
ncbi:MAG: ABC transporter substrate-binding protein, partial [Deltaproteobacteria bacterium]|nr:ABC transporter substrate-binding protein [Deltaproteobacteria bacterium]